MRYKRITEEDVVFLKGVCGENHVYLGEKINFDLNDNQLTNMLFIPEVVVEPKTTKAVSDIMQYANDNNIPVNPRQQGKELIGGILISMNKVVKQMELDEENLTSWFR